MGDVPDLVGTTQERQAAANRLLQYLLAALEQFSDEELQEALGSAPPGASSNVGEAGDVEEDDWSETWEVPLTGGPTQDDEDDWHL